MDSQQRKDGVLVLVEDGHKKVKITNSGYGLEIYTMRNGFQWTGQGVDEKMLLMILDAIKEYFHKQNLPSGVK